jgi:2-polyprenyl-3-methyl-5-hydroxy-6-metoxy-1,4-benzoquinol methylase
MMAGPMDQTKEPQYQDHVELARSKGQTRLGLRANATWDLDPRRFMIVLARYKFVAKMLSGRERVLEVGCGDAFGTRIVQQEVKSVCAIDFDPVFVSEVNERMEPKWKFDCIVHDMLSGPVPGGFEAAYSLDVIEHIPASDEDQFMGNIAQSLTGLGVCIIGTPSLESQAYASAGSKAGHINCKSAAQLRALMNRFFQEVFIFSMNDEVVHTGFYAMAHYLFALGVGKRGPSS